MSSKKKNIVIVCLLSLIPGLSQIYVGKGRKAIGLLVIDAGIFLTLIFSDTYVMKMLMCGIYVVTFLPSFLESYQIARYGKNTIDTSARWYVTMLLLTTGFSALPMLWQSEYFSKKAKIAWSIAVPILAIIFFTSLARYWEVLEKTLENIITA